MKHKKLFALFIILAMLSTVLSVISIYGGTVFNNNINGTYSSGTFNGTWSGDFLGDTVTSSKFTFTQESGNVLEGTLEVGTAKGLVIATFEGTYDDMTREFVIEDFTYSKYLGYKYYTINIVRIWGEYESSSNFTAQVYGEYTASTSTPEPEEDDDEGCDINVRYENNSNSQSLYVEVTADKDISSAGAVFYAVGGGSSASNFNRLSDRLYFTDFAYGSVAVQRFTVAVTFKDGDSETRGPFTVSSSSGSGWPSGSGTTTTGNDYSTALAKAKNNGFTTVTAYIDDMNTSIKAKNSQITTLQTNMTAKITEISTLTEQRDRYKSDYDRVNSQYNSLQTQYNTLQTNYNNLAQGLDVGTDKPATTLPIDIDTKYVIGGVVLLALAYLVISGKIKLPKLRKGKKVNIHEGIPQEEVYERRYPDEEARLKKLEIENGHN